MAYNSISGLLEKIVEPPVFWAALICAVVVCEGKKLKNSKLFFNERWFFEQGLEPCLSSSSAISSIGSVNRTHRHLETLQFIQIGVYKVYLFYPQLLIIRLTNKSINLSLGISAIVQCLWEGCLLYG